MRRAALAVLWFLLIPPIYARPAERICFLIRNKEQQIHFVPAQGRAKPEAILFMPGDAGWLGSSVDMAQLIAALGYNVYGFDVKDYLSGFTGTSTLTEATMAQDLRSLGAWVHRQSGQPVVFAGWSQGANMGLLGGVTSKSDSFCLGVLAIGLGERAVLGWRFVDNLTYITKQEPNEPVFLALPHIGNLSPLPLAIVASTNDEYVKSEATQRLFRAAGDPKRLFLVPAKNHRFSGNQSGFSKAVESGLLWIHDSNGNGATP